MTTAAFGFDSVGFSMQGSRDAYLRELENTTSSATSGMENRKKGKQKTPRRQRNLNCPKRKQQSFVKA